LKYKSIPNTDLNVSGVSLGTWVFDGSSWGGSKENDCIEAVHAAADCGINLIDTAPVYGRGRSERVIGDFIGKRGARKKIILATKVGLSWIGPIIRHNLKRKRMLEEVDESRKRLKTDYFDLYQVHWPDPDTAIGETAQVMQELYQKKIIKAVGVSNYSVDQMQEFMKCCPLHCLQPQYSMFVRDIEEGVVPFCLKNNIAIITYAPLYSGLLTGKFFFGQAQIPGDTNRKMKKKDLEEPKFSINKETLQNLKDIAASYSKTLAQLVINWNFSQKGITSSIVGIRNLSQLRDNSASLGWKISDDDLQRIDQILKERERKIKSL